VGALSRRHALSGRQCDYVRSMWAHRGGDGEFVPSPLGLDYDGWELPGVMARRRALWERADVAAIVGGR
jgi:hypothetical protein